MNDSRERAIKSFPPRRMRKLARARARPHAKRLKKRERKRARDERDFYIIVRVSPKASYCRINGTSRDICINNAMIMQTGVILGGESAVKARREIFSLPCVITNRRESIANLGPT